MARMCFSTETSRTRPSAEPLSGVNSDWLLASVSTKAKSGEQPSLGYKSDPGWSSQDICYQRITLKLTSASWIQILAR